MAIVAQVADVAPGPLVIIISGCVTISNYISKFLTSSLKCSTGFISELKVLKQVNYLNAISFLSLKLCNYPLMTGNLAYVDFVTYDLISTQVQIPI